LCHIVVDGVEAVEGLSFVRLDEAKERAFQGVNFLFEGNHLNEWFIVKAFSKKHRTALAIVSLHAARL
jgi:pimeloyl-CoA synthetase